MHTEEEAKTKWCPFYRMTAGLDNRGNAEWHDNRWDNLGISLCIASECMAWRWESAGGDMVRQDNEPGTERKGFCGLAGKP